MLTLRDILNAGVEFEAADTYVKHWNDEKEDYDIVSPLSARDDRLLDMEVRYVYPLSDSELCIEVIDY